MGRKIISTVLISGGLLGPFLFSPVRAAAAPLLANYFLGTLPTDEASIATLARYHVLILTPEQAVVSQEVINDIKQRNPSIILLAYVPSKSYLTEWEVYPGNTVYNGFTVNPEWWLKDSAGRITSDWPGHLSTNMSAGWSDYLVDFVRDKILSAGVWDGVFFDVVYDGISWFNQGDLDLDRNGIRDEPGSLDTEWARRIEYLLTRAQEKLGVRYLVINGSSDRVFQPSVNGRLYENFPTPWEAHGSWGGLMNKLQVNQKQNRAPLLTVFNANTNNTGNRLDWRRMRFGLTSALLLDDVYFSFDHGTESHHQIWWYDEYDVPLGAVAAPATSPADSDNFSEGVWRRDYQGGLALVNATNEAQEVALGGEFERLIGKQDPETNDGSISEEVSLPPRDGLLLLRTTQSLSAVPFVNGSFVRFFTGEGARARNGFFSFRDGYVGSAVIYQGDLDGAPGAEQIIATGPKLEIFNSRGERWFNDYPFGANFRGTLRLSVVRSAADRPVELIIAGSNNGEVQRYAYYGKQLGESIFPLGKKYRGGFAVAAGDLDGDGKPEVVFGTGGGRAAEVLVYDAELTKERQRFQPGGKKINGPVAVAVGNFRAGGAAELAVALGQPARPRVKILSGRGVLQNEFPVSVLPGSVSLFLGAAPGGAGLLDAVVVLSR
ncbi:MAG: hypothetical protein HYV42_01040 [Candidatus Magasanikbacteria bacterium]|nr:hypothetical protein [Candidatus Magasanikbacteria bacterium]